MIAISAVVLQPRATGCMGGYFQILPDSLLTDKGGWIVDDLLMILKVIWWWFSIFMTLANEGMGLGKKLQIYAYIIN